jgi:hypothetical protein
VLEKRLAPEPGLAYSGYVASEQHGRPPEDCVGIVRARIGRAAR